MNSNAKRKWLLELKRKHTPESLCKERAAALLPFVKAVFKMKFFDRPNHDHLAFLLRGPRYLNISNSRKNSILNMPT